MERICEPELMDDPLQARSYADADFSASDAALVERILDLAGPGGLGSKVVDLGCGPGNISFRLAAALPQVHVLGIDGAAAMLALAERQRGRDPLRWSRLRFLQACLPLPVGTLAPLPVSFAPPYSALISNSLLHHLPDPAVLWRAIAQLAAPGALVVVRDLRRPQDEATLQTLVDRHVATAPAVLRRDFSNSLRAAFLPEEVGAQLAAAGLSSLSVSSLEDRYLEVYGQL